MSGMDEGDDLESYYLPSGLIGEDFDNDTNASPTNSLHQAPAPVYSSPSPSASNGGSSWGLFDDNSFSGNSFTSNWRSNWEPPTTNPSFSAPVSPFQMNTNRTESRSEEAYNAHFFSGYNSMPQRNMSYQQANMGNGYPSMSYVTPAPSIHNYTSSSPSYQPFGSYSNTKGGADLMNLLKPKEIPKPEVIQHSSGHKPLEPFTMYSPTDQDDSLFEPIEPPKTKSRKNKWKDKTERKNNNKGQWKNKNKNSKDSKDSNIRSVTILKKSEINVDDQQINDNTRRSPQQSKRKRQSKSPRRNKNTQPMDSNSQNKGVIEETIVPTVSENKNLVKVEEKEDVVDEKPIDVENNEDIVQEIPDNDLTTEEIPSPSIEKEDEEIIEDAVVSDLDNDTPTDDLSETTPVDDETKDFTGELIDEIKDLEEKDVSRELPLDDNSMSDSTEQDTSSNESDKFINDNSDDEVDIEQEMKPKSPSFLKKSIRNSFIAFNDAFNFLTATFLRLFFIPLVNIHHSALNMFCIGSVAFTILYVYSFPYLVATVADASSASIIWYLFLIWFFINKRSTSKSSTPPALNFRLLLPLLFVFEGVCNPKFIVMWNGGERLVLAFVLLSMKTNNFLHWNCFISLALLIITSVILGTNIIVQWAILVIALSSLSPSFSWDPIMKTDNSSKKKEEEKEEEKTNTNFKPSYEANILPSHSPNTSVGFYHDNTKRRKRRR